MIPYSRQSISDQDIEAVVDVLRSDFLTTGPLVEQFENKFAETIGAEHTVALSSGTAALHLAVQALGIGTGDQVIVPNITFVATASAVKYCGAEVVLADVNPDTLLIDCLDVENKITNKTKAIIPVDYAGQNCDMNELKRIATKYDLFIIQDACHSLGTKLYGDISCFSFHPVKHITTGEGGMVATRNKTLAHKVKMLRNHGRDLDGAIELGYNYRLSDIACALGISQLDRLEEFINARVDITILYGHRINNSKVKFLLRYARNCHSFHLFVVKVKDRKTFRSHLEFNGIGTQVHYKPLTLQPLYSDQKGSCPVSEEVWKELVSIPIFPDMTDDDINKVIEAVNSY